MGRSTWHPYAPDQAFGHQAAVDQQLLDEALTQLERHRQHPPRAGSKAEPFGQDAPAGTQRSISVAGWVVSADGLPVTTNVALDAAERVRSEAD